MSATKISIVAPCENEEEKWQREFVSYATRRDTDGFPLEGEFAMGFNCPINLNTTTEGERRDRAYEAAREARRRAGEKVREGEISNRISSLLGAHKHLVPGTIFAFKRGFTVVAFAVITAPYRYEGSQAWGKHRWGYRVLRRATAEEAGPYNIPARGETSAVPAPVKAFNKDYLPMPADLPSLTQTGVRARSIVLADQKVAERRCAEMAAVETAQRAHEAVAAAAEALAAAQRALEQVREAAAAADAAVAGARRDVAAALNERELAELF